ncbi:Diacylglycerol kinase, catalytic region [Corynebacterium kutscheri]|uniref:Diacylglycerol kinase, catalytic region n=2 Tax=Corynebacterium kutscheri TaxID=35755 RepID=A0AB38VS89_9CORY|nr:Diacylglycerol kinase, catalytic region [Corynebacterium kutscheri]
MSALRLGIMRALLIANPQSTSQSGHLFGYIVRLLRTIPDFKLKVMFTHYPGHAQQLVTGLSRKNYDVVIAVGGDGTVNGVINGLLPDKQTLVAHPEIVTQIPRLAVIPTGSANVFARALGFPMDAYLAVETLVIALQHNQTRFIGAGTYNDKWFVVNAGIGLDADAIVAMERVRRKGFSATPLRYLRVSARAAFKLWRNPPHIDVRASNKHGDMVAHKDIPLCFASNTNPWTFFGPLPVVTNPLNSFDAGVSLFGLNTFSALGRVAGLMHMSGIGHNRFLSQWLSSYVFTFDDAVEVELYCSDARQFQIDGEYAGEVTYVRLEAIPQAIEVYAPIEKVADSPTSIARKFFSFFDLRL